MKQSSFEGITFAGFVTIDGEEVATFDTPVGRCVQWSASPISRTQDNALRVHLGGKSCSSRLDEQEEAQILFVYSDTYRYVWSARPVALIALYDLPEHMELGWHDSTVLARPGFFLEYGRRDVHNAPALKAFGNALALAFGEGTEVDAEASKLHLDALTTAQDYNTLVQDLLAKIEAQAAEITSLREQVKALPSSTYVRWLESQIES